MAQSARTPRADSLATQERILQSSEKLFGRDGYSATSLRAIAQDAGVNLAAAHYHFGSKRRLLQSTLRRSVEPINRERLDRLNGLEARAQCPTLESVVRAFVEPVFESLPTAAFPSLLARVFAEPTSLSVPLLQETFRPVGSRFGAALARALPELPQAALAMRIHCMIGAMVHLARFAEPIDLLGTGPSRKHASATPDVEALIDFAVAGLCQGTAMGAAH